MANDQQTYQRGANAALFGLITQIVLTFATVIVGIYAGSAPYYAAAFHAFAGIFIWIILFLLYNQHRLERTEALEAEQLAASDANMAALFNESEENLRVARRRLERLYKWGLNVVSCLTGTYLLVLGLVLLHQTYWVYGVGADPATVSGILNIGPNLLRPGVTLGLLVVFSIGLAMIAFIVARYEAGMTKVAEWQMLRGGAAFLVGNALTLGLCAVGVATMLFNWGDATLAAVSQIVPAMMAILGAETLLVFLLNIYRPRRPGETPRPAFDSRLLGMLTSPTSLAKAIGDALNYQFGFEVSQSWFFRLLMNTLPLLIGVGVLVLLAMSCIVVIEPHQQGVITRFGKNTNAQQPLQPGLHLKAPWPISKVRRLDVTPIREIVVTTSPNPIGATERVLWNVSLDEDAERDRYFITASRPPTDSDLAAAIERMTADAQVVSLFSAQVNVQWRINDADQYLRSVEQPAQVLESICEQVVNEFFLRQDIDSVIGQGRGVMGDQLRELIQARVNSAGPDGQPIGVTIVFVGLHAVRPPAEAMVATSFENQVGAIQEAATTIERARGDANRILAATAGSPQLVDQLVQKIDAYKIMSIELETLIGDSAAPQDIEAKREQRVAMVLEIEDLLIRHAQGRASEMLVTSRAESWQRIMRERSRSLRFDAQRQAYRNAPNYYMMREFLQVMSEGIATSRKVVLDGDVETRGFRLDLTDSQTFGMDFFRPESATD